MYTLSEITSDGFSYIELTSPDEKSKVSICLNQGGRLSNLVFENVQILANFNPSTYNDNYASAILFPFANRIKDGEYTFNDSKYNLDCNEIKKNNALHGLVYDKRFVYSQKQLTSEYAAVTLCYSSDGKSKGFPFMFKIELTYSLSKIGMNLAVKITNKDKNPFPFTLGWHPYFKSADLDRSSVNFKSNQKYQFDKQQIIAGTMQLDTDMPLQLRGETLDDEYCLNTNQVQFFTPDYHLKLTSSSKENFLQLYTPAEPNIIAIEPMTGAANNFNNKIGLQTLRPNDIYNLEWNVNMETNAIKEKLTN